MEWRFAFAGELPVSAKSRDAELTVHFIGLRGGALGDCASESDGRRQREQGTPAFFCKISPLC